MTGAKKFLLFTDLDGALLDHDTYSLDEARDTVFALKRRGVSLICNSSKTDAEIRGYLEELELAEPFISEGGSVLFSPRGRFPIPPGPWWEEGDYRVYLLGRSVDELRDAFSQMRDALGLPLKAAFEMDDRQLVQATGLSMEKIPLMQQRRASVPFLASGEAPAELWEKVREWALSHGLGYARGGRFHHLTGPTDKGKAAAFLTGMYLSFHPHVVTVGVGDGLNDLPLLEWADHGIAIPTKSGVRPELLNVSGVRVAPAAGPSGWKAGVEELFRTLGFELFDDSLSP